MTDCTDSSIAYDLEQRDHEIARLRVEVEHCQAVSERDRIRIERAEAEVARLLGNLEVCGEQRSHAEKREMALRACVTQLVGALRDCAPRRHTDFCAAENHPGLPCSCPYETARAALAAAEKLGA